ncbi:MAG: hypothetical protein EXR79_01315 [Myxococcales bacterium]|nr:hypothetical protein [Myxococcales bacterium]
MATWSAVGFAVLAACGSAQLERAPGAGRHGPLPGGTPITEAETTDELAQPVEIVGLLKLEGTREPTPRGDAVPTFLGSAGRYGCDAVVKPEEVREEIKTPVKRKSMGAGGAPLMVDDIDIRVEFQWVALCARTGRAGAPPPPKPEPVRAEPREPGRPDAKVEPRSEARSGVATSAGRPDPAADRARPETAAERACREAEAEAERAAEAARMAAKVAAEKAEVARKANEHAEKERRKLDSEATDRDRKKATADTELKDKLKAAQDAADRARLSAVAADRAKAANEAVEKDRRRFALDAAEKARLAAEDPDKGKARTAAEAAEKARIATDAADVARTAAENAEKERKRTDAEATDRQKAYAAVLERELKRTGSDNSEAAETADRERKAKEAAAAAERERKAKGAAEVAERERKAKEAADAAERERKAKGAAEVAERDRKAKESAERDKADKDPPDKDKPGAPAAMPIAAQPAAVPSPAATREAAEAAERDRKAKELADAAERERKAREASQSTARESSKQALQGALDKAVADGSPQAWLDFIATFADTPEAAAAYDTLQRAVAARASDWVQMDTPTIAQVEVERGPAIDSALLDKEMKAEGATAVRMVSPRDYTVRLTLRNATKHAVQVEAEGGGVRAARFLTAGASWSTAQTAPCTPHGNPTSRRKVGSMLELRFDCGVDAALRVLAVRPIKRELAVDRRAAEPDVPFEVIARVWQAVPATVLTEFYVSAVQDAMRRRAEDLSVVQARLSVGKKVTPDGPNPVQASFRNTSGRDVVVVFDLGAGRDERMLVPRLQTAEFRMDLPPAVTPDLKVKGLLPRLRSTDWLIGVWGFADARVVVLPGDRPNQVIAFVVPSDGQRAGGGTQARVVAVPMTITDNLVGGEGDVPAPFTAALFGGKVPVGCENGCRAKLNARLSDLDQYILGAGRVLPIEVVVGDRRGAFKLNADH